MAQAIILMAVTSPWTDLELYSTICTANTCSGGAKSSSIAEHFPGYDIPKGYFRSSSTYGTVVTLVVNNSVNVHFSLFSDPVVDESFEGWRAASANCFQIKHVGVRLKIPQSVDFTMLK